MNDTDRLKVFISYARRDGAAFADELMNGLELGGFDAFLDREDIAVGEAWEQRLEALIAVIAAADTVLFVTTPGSVTSERCGWEVDRALALGKRVVPVMAVKVSDDRLPSALSEINYIDFSAQSSFTRSLKLLASALNKDVDWLREHTRRPCPALGCAGPAGHIAAAWPRPRSSERVAEHNAKEFEAYAAAHRLYRTQRRASGS